MIWFIILGLAFAWCMLPKDDGVYSITDNHQKKVIRRMTHAEAMEELREKHKKNDL